MKPIVLSCMLLFASLSTGAQTTPPTGAAAVPVAGGSPVVIRNNESSARSEGSGKSESTGKATSTTASSTPTERVLAPLPATDFENFVTAALGHSLPVFGAQLFRNGGDTFALPTNVAPPADYVLGQGDEVLIRTVGKIDIDSRATVDRNGQIFLPRVGMLTVAGMRLDQLTDFIHSAIAQQFTGFDLSVSLGTLRSIQVFVLGQARSPGVYTISSLSTLVNALFATGGPSSTGSLRDIQVRRNGGVIAHLDLYDLLLKGEKTSDIHLLPGDTIFIPNIGPQTAVDGNVRTPAIYEMKPRSTVGDLLADAGGLTPVADRSRAVLEHVVAQSRRSVEELALTGPGLTIPLQDGDILRVLPISPKISGAVTLRGNVANPGRYSYREGMRVSDVIPTRASLITRDYYTRQNVGQSPSIATSNNGGTTAPVVNTQASPVANTASSPNAATQFQDRHDTEVNFNYAVIERLDPETLTTNLIPFALGEAIDQPSSAENKLLQPGDTIVVYSERDVALPLELRAKFVLIDGQVKAPGLYRVGENETLRELVIRAGGLVPKAYLYASRLTRESVRRDQEEKLRALVERESREVLSPNSLRASALPTTGAAPDTQVELRKAYIAELSKVQPDGRVVLQLSPSSTKNDDVPNFALEDGDHFFVPTTPNTVEVLGTVYNQGALRYLQGARAREYLNAAGGPTRDGDSRREFIMRADGTVVSLQSLAGQERLHLYSGDSFLVHAKLRSSFSIADVIG